MRRARFPDPDHRLCRRVSPGPTCHEDTAHVSIHGASRPRPSGSKDVYARDNVPPGANLTLSNNTPAFLKKASG